MASWSNAQFKDEVLIDEMGYTHLQQDLCLSLWDYIESFEGEAYHAAKHFFMPPGIFDGVVSILSQEMNKKPIRPYLCDKDARHALIHQFVSKIRATLTAKNHQVKDFSEICEAMPMIKLQLNKADLGPLADLQGRDVVEYKMYM